MTTPCASLDGLLKALLEETLHLQKRLIEDAEPEEWNDILERRQGIMDQLSGLLDAGNVLTKELKEAYLLPAAEADRRLFPLMNGKKMKLASEMAHFQKSKAVNEQYGGYGNVPTAYGAFFDKRN